MCALSADGGGDDGAGGDGWCFCFMVTNRGVGCSSFSRPLLYPRATSTGDVLGLRECVILFCLDNCLAVYTAKKYQALHVLYVYILSR